MSSVLATRSNGSGAAGWGRGEVAERFTKDVTRTIKGTEVSRKATSDSPAYLIEQEDGDRVLKSHSEIEKDS